MSSIGHSCIQRKGVLPFLDTIDDKLMANKSGAAVHSASISLEMDIDCHFLEEPGDGEFSIWIGAYGR